MTPSPPTLERLWHYTKGTKVLGIIADGKILRARVGVQKPERRAVWFSTHADWEPTVTINRIDPDGTLHTASLEAMVRVIGVLVRLEVPAERFPHTWADHRRLGQIDGRMADALEKAAREDGADPAQWRVSYHDVPITEVLRIEASDDGVTWVQVGIPNGNGGFQLEPSFEARIRATLEAST